jgi:hypothetical protein
MVDKIVDTVKSITVDAAKATSNVVTDTAKLTADAVVGTAKLTADAVTGTAKLTADAVTGTAKFTADAVAGTAKFTADAVTGTAKFTANAFTETAKFTSGVVGSTIQVFNPKDWIITFARQYLVSYFLAEEPVNTTQEKIEKNSIYAATVFAVHPMERVRLLIQNQHMYKDAIPYQGGQSYTLKYCGAFDCFFKEMREKGIRMLWRGVSPMLAYRIFYFNMLDFRIKTMFDYYQNAGTASDKAPNTSNFINFCEKVLYLYYYDFALFTGSHPFEVLFTKFGCNPVKPKELNYSFYKSYAFCNPINLYQGYAPGFIMLNLNYLLMTPFVYYLGLQAYDQLQLFIYILAALSFVEYLTYPFEIIKRRLIVQNCQEYSEFKYKSVLNSIAKIYREEHISGFYKGAFLKCMNYGVRRLLFVTSLGYYNDYTKPK